MADLDKAVERIEQGEAWVETDEVVQVEVKKPLDKVIKQERESSAVKDYVRGYQAVPESANEVKAAHRTGNTTLAEEPWDIGLRVCGPWLRYSFLKRVGLIIIFWPIYIFIGVKVSIPLWRKYFCWRWLHIGKPLTWGDVTERPDPDDFHEILPLDFYWAIALAGRRRWLWYEPLEQLQRNKDGITYPVDWAGKSDTWYPFW